MLWVFIILTFSLIIFVSIFGNQEERRLKKENKEIERLKGDRNG